MPLRSDWKGHLVPPDSWTKRRLVQAVVWFTILFLYVFVVPRTLPPLYFPGPTELFQSLSKMGWAFPVAAAYTGYRALAGFGIGSSIGLVVALLMFRSESLTAGIYSLIEVVRPLPPVALTLFLILWFKLHWIGPLILISLGCFMVLVVSTYEALANLNVNLLRAARSLGATDLSYWFAVLLPAILPDLVAPIRVSLALAFAVTISAEFMGVQTGIGFYMLVARAQLDTGTIFLGLLIITAEAGLLDAVIRNMMRHFTNWRRLS